MTRNQPLSVQPPPKNKQSSNDCADDRSCFPSTNEMGDLNMQEKGEAKKEAGACVEG